MLTQLVTEGLYNPLRDTQLFGPPQAFYDRVSYYIANPGGTQDTGLTAGTYTSDEISLRTTNVRLPLPTGEGLFVLGANHVRGSVDDYAYESRYGNGTLRVAEARPGKSQYNWGVFAELRAPLLPRTWLPQGLQGVMADIAYRYAGSNTYEQSPNPPTVGLRLDFAGGISLRGTYSLAYATPTPEQSIPRVPPVPNTTEINDPSRGGETYEVAYLDSPNPDLLTEEGKTLSLGLIFQRGTVHQFRASLDRVHTDMTNELTFFGPGTALVHEQYYPDRVEREAAAPGDPFPAGRVTFVRSGWINVLGRDTKDWTAALGYTWTQAYGGSLGFYANAYKFQSYKTQLMQTTPVVENIENPDGSFPSILKYRATFGLGWQRPAYTLGIEGRYYHSQVVYRYLQVDQGDDRVDPYREYDLYYQADLDRLLPFKGIGLRGQLRINNLFAADMPFQAGALGNVAAYGDWRGRTYSLSMTASFR